MCLKCVLRVRQNSAFFCQKVGRVAKGRQVSWIYLTRLCNWNELRACYPTERFAILEHEIRRLVNIILLEIVFGFRFWGLSIVKRSVGPAFFHASHRSISSASFLSSTLNITFNGMLLWEGRKRERERQKKNSGNLSHPKKKPQESLCSVKDAGHLRRVQINNNEKYFF